ncbi:MAG: hypothetical protein IPP79_21040 [Chitinophagaceae bacterium]|nr:hypothetical protein [Chitinophagaceae bacterium]
MKIAILRIAFMLMLALSCINTIKAQTGTALDFNGSDSPETAQYLVIPGMPELYSFTFEFDIKYKGGNQGYDRILSTTNHGFNMAIDENGMIRLQSTDLDFWWTDRLSAAT